MLFDDDIANALKALRDGGIILYPTDTVWGLGCDATNHKAVNRLFDLKGRDNAKAMLVLVDSIDMARQYVEELSDVAADIMELATSPTTLVLDDARKLPQGLIGADGSVGMRLTREPWSAALCRALKRPIVSTSANFSGRPAPAFFNEIDPELVKAVDYCAASRRDESGPRPRPSAIIKIGRDASVKILRH